jgi:hypothetical protein
MIWLFVSVVRSSLFSSNTIRINKTLAHSHHSFPHDVYNYILADVSRLSSFDIGNKQNVIIKYTHTTSMLWHSMSIEFEKENHKQKSMFFCHYSRPIINCHLNIWQYVHINNKNIGWIYDRLCSNNTSSFLLYTITKSCCSG